MLEREWSLRLEEHRGHQEWEMYMATNNGPAYRQTHGMAVEALNAYEAELAAQAEALRDARQCAEHSLKVWREAQAEAAVWFDTARWLWRHANGYHFVPESDNEVRDYEDALSHTAEIMTDLTPSVGQEMLEELAGLRQDNQRLQALGAELTETIRRIEWEGTDLTPSCLTIRVCPECRSAEGLEIGHVASCSIAAALDEDAPEGTIGQELLDKLARLRAVAEVARRRILRNACGGEKTRLRDCTTCLDYGLCLALAALDAGGKEEASYG